MRERVGGSQYLYFVCEMRKEIRASEHDCMEKIAKRRCVCHVWGGVSRLIQGVGECGSLVKTKACVISFMQYSGKSPVAQRRIVL
jgi:hypothetical protein